MAKSVSLTIDAEAIVNRIVKKHNLSLPPEIIMWHYEEADTLYLHFKYPAKAVDNQIVDKEGQIILGRDRKKRHSQHDYHKRLHNVFLA